MDGLEDIFRRNEQCILYIKKESILVNNHELSLLAHPVTETVTSVKAIFELVRGNYRFYDYAMLEKLVDLSHLSEAKKLMGEYILEIQDILIQGLNINIAREYEYYNPTNKMEVSCGMQIISAEQQHFLIITLHKCLGLPPYSVLLKDVKTGSIVLTYEILPNVRDYLRNLTITAHQLKPLVHFKIQHLIINKEVELKVPLNCDTEVCNNIHVYIASCALHCRFRF